MSLNLKRSKITSSIYELNRKDDLTDESDSRSLSHQRKIKSESFNVRSSSWSIRQKYQRYLDARRVQSKSPNSNRPNTEYSDHLFNLALEKSLINQLKHLRTNYIRGKKSRHSSYKIKSNDILIKTLEESSHYVSVNLHKHSSSVDHMSLHLTSSASQSISKPIKTLHLNQTGDDLPIRDAIEIMDEGTPNKNIVTVNLTDHEENKEFEKEEGDSEPGTYLNKVLTCHINYADDSGKEKLRIYDIKPETKVVKIGVTRSFNDSAQTMNKLVLTIDETKSHNETTSLLDEKSNEGIIINKSQLPVVWNLTDGKFRKQNKWGLNFSQSNPIAFTFTKDNIISKEVTLLSLLIKPSTIFSIPNYENKETELLPEKLTGVVCVLNLSFEKCVIVRVTTNTWLDYHDYQANYLLSLNPDSRENQYDLFGFEFNLPSDKTIDKLEFAIRYDWIDENSLKQTSWDNNEGNNYVLDCRNTPDGEN